MTKKIWGVIFVALLGFFLLGGCGQQKDLKETLTAGDGKWELQTSEDTFKIVFFSDGKAIAASTQSEQEGKFLTDNEEKKIELIDPDTDDVITTIDTITIESNELIKGTLKKDGNDSVSAKLIKMN